MAYVTGETEAQELFYNFPDMFEQAQKDWVKFKLGLQNNLFSESQKQEVWEWFKDFPQVWETVRPNWSENSSAVQRRWGQRVDAFVSEIKSYGGLSGLGIAPLVIAGILIVGGVAAAIWGVSYFKKQSNVSKLIDGVTAGKISSEILDTALKNQSSGPGLFGDVSGLIKWAVIGGVILLVVIPGVRLFFERKS
jgi:hypothetical protein